jgi:hypothetical protein
MRTNVAVESVNDITDYITQSQTGNRHHHKNTCMFICLVIGIGLLSSLLVPTIIMTTTVQAYSSGGIDFNASLKPSKISLYDVASFLRYYSCCS